jgi:hypothetical protein
VYRTWPESDSSSEDSDDEDDDEDEEEAELESEAWPEACFKSIWSAIAANSGSCLCNNNRVVNPSIEMTA